MSISFYAPDLKCRGQITRFMELQDDIDAVRLNCEWNEDECGEMDGLSGFGESIPSYGKYNRVET